MPLESAELAAAAAGDGGEADEEAELGILGVGGFEEADDVGRVRWCDRLQSYADKATGDLPVNWLVVADSSDASTDVRRALSDGRVTVPLAVRALLNAVATRFSEGDEPTAIDATVDFNLAAAQHGVPAILLPIDLEFATLGAATPAVVRRLCTEAGLAELPKADLLRQLGSKAGQSPIADAKKHDWIRGRIGQLVPWGQLDDAVHHVVRRWLLGAAEAGPVDDLLAKVR